MRITMLFSVDGELFPGALLVRHCTERDAVFAATLTCPGACRLLVLVRLLQHSRRTLVKRRRVLSVRILPVSLHT